MPPIKSGIFFRFRLNLCILVTIPNFATNYMPIPCPKCTYQRCWNLRRNKKKCKRCKTEFSGKIYLVAGMRATEIQWRSCIRIFLRQRTIQSIVEETELSHCRVENMVIRLRECMKYDIPAPFSGPIEMDETYIGGQRKNKRLHIRKIKTKRGHGTDKLPIVGIFDRSSGNVFVDVMPKKLDMPYIIATVKKQTVANATVYTDGFKMYRMLPKHGFTHEYVDHAHDEFVRQNIHTNNIEGFWGILKRKLGCIGGIRRDKLHLFVAEIVWKFNHRHESKKKQEDRLILLLKNSQIGGKK